MENGYPIGYENMTPVQRALESASHALVTFDVLRVADHILDVVDYALGIGNPKEEDY